jgi:hypothetical protein
MEIKRSEIDRIWYKCGNEKCGHVWRGSGRKIPGMCVKCGYKDHIAVHKIEISEFRTGAEILKEEYMDRRGHGA